MANFWFQYKFVTSDACNVEEVAKSRGLGETDGGGRQHVGGHVNITQSKAWNKIDINYSHSIWYVRNSKSLQCNSACELFAHPLGWNLWPSMICSVWYMIRLFKISEKEDLTLTAEEEYGWGGCPRRNMANFCSGSSAQVSTSDHCVSQGNGHHQTCHQSRTWPEIEKSITLNKLRNIVTDMGYISMLDKLWNYLFCIGFYHSVLTQREKLVSW